MVKKCGGISLPDPSPPGVPVLSHYRDNMRQPDTGKKWWHRVVAGVNGGNAMAAI